MTDDRVEQVLEAARRLVAAFARNCHEHLSAMPEYLPSTS